MKPTIITPISHLSQDEDFLKAILAFGSLEGRDHNTCFKHFEHIRVFHSDVELQLKWNNEIRNDLHEKFSRLPNLEAISFHMVTKFKNYSIHNGIAFGIGEPMSDNEMEDNVSLNCKWLKTKFPKLKIMVENNNDLGSDAYKIVTETKFITKIILNNNIFLLYDHAHALISAYNQKINFDDYFNGLPLNKVVQVHLSEPTFHNGVARDAHEFPTIKSIEFCLQNFGDQAKYYTLEYYKSLPKLIQGLQILKRDLN